MTSLTLAFPASLLPPSTLPLPQNHFLRPLSKSDHSISHSTVLSALTSVPPVSTTTWEHQFTQMAACPNTYYPIVIIDQSTEQIVAMGTLFMERKFIRGCGTAGHLEDIVVGENQQGKGLGKIIINVLTELSETLGAYKTILDCDVKNEGFYVKCGYENKGYEMAKYAKKD